jgi:hypothetical protein
MEMVGLAIFENLSTLNPNFSVRVMRLGENFSRPPTHLLGISFYHGIWRDVQGVLL